MGNCRNAISDIPWLYHDLLPEVIEKAYFQVHDLMDDISEQQEVGQEIAEAISNPVGFGQDVDEDELLAELEELEQEELDQQLLDVGPTPASTLPEAPSAEPAGKAKPAKAREDDDLKELEAWAAMWKFIHKIFCVV